jgi:chemotaxis receptor (MCP) glutamine deamidase CheD
VGQSDGTQIRSYVNNVEVKVAQSDVITEMKGSKARKIEYFVQKFKVIKTTTFEELRD